MGSEVITTGKTWQQIAVAWLVNQGVSTVLLFCILAGAYVQIPKHIEAITQGYKSVSDRHDAAIEKLATSHEKAVDRIMNALEHAREKP